ncbi:MAG: aromatic ring-hydroxylating oxygenase subunit alpha [Ginsengibacter sp.]
MESNISPAYYFQKEIFEKEKQNIFKTCWQFIGNKRDLVNNNDFITNIIADVPIVVQNFNGSIKAFLNVCSHRFSIIQQGEIGSRPLVCPYHGWSYDENGTPKGIPKKPLFKDFSNEELCRLSLMEFAVEFCGDLCFVKLDNEGGSLRDYLGEFYKEIEIICNSLGRLSDVNSMTIDANWKVIVENTLESYHVGLVHTNTFRKLGATGLRFNFNGFHSNWIAPVTLKREDPAFKKINDCFDTEYQIDGYIHYLVFPNLLISSTYGTSFNFSFINPINNNTTKFTSYVFLGKTKDTARKAIVDAFEQTLVDFNKQVFKEDKDICELVQNGVVHTKQQGVLSLEEERVHAFQNNYLKLMENGS